ncbi:uncharacterized protein Fot_51680 [Forsythia ovata]|uniref:Uncharacterized protein n=1 Tax=Forsythia ovata TaxID=205694 RepID=A0ABD1PW49_9LAMI
MQSRQSRLFRSVFLSFSIMTPAACKFHSLPGGNLPDTRSAVGNRITGKLFGYRKGRASFSIQETSGTLLALKSCKEASVSASSICTDLASLRDLHEDINNLIQLPSLQQALVDENRANELLDGSLKLVDICGIARDVIFLTKESVQELESSLRRNRGIDAYMTSRKKIDKMVKKCIQNLKSFDPCSTSLLNKDSNLKAIANVVKKAQAIGFSPQRLFDQSGCKSRNVHEWQRPEGESQQANPQDRPLQYFSENPSNTGIEPTLPEDFSPRHLKPYQLDYSDLTNSPMLVLYN